MKMEVERLLSPLAFGGAGYYIAEKAEIWNQMDLMLNHSCVT